MWQSLPEFGTGVLYAILVAAAYTFAVSLAAGRGRPRLADGGRIGAYATCGLVLLGVLLLAYAFQAHDFRIRYVAHYSDRSMPWVYLFTALWGGQDGSLLWWSLLLSIYTAARGVLAQGPLPRAAALHHRHADGDHRVLLGLDAVRANPFETTIAGARPDGEGLNPLLQNYWMIIHPPALYMGFVGCSVPFAFASRRWSRAGSTTSGSSRPASGCCSLGCSCRSATCSACAGPTKSSAGAATGPGIRSRTPPSCRWFTAAAYVHSTMIQERRGMLKVWNVLLICLTFFLTIFGTFLTRSGMIASVHSLRAERHRHLLRLYFMGVIAGGSASG